MRTKMPGYFFLKWTRHNASMCKSDCCVWDLVKKIGNHWFGELAAAGGGWCPDVSKRSDKCETWRLLQGGAFKCKVLQSGNPWKTQLDVHEISILCYFALCFWFKKNQESGGMGSLRPRGVCWCDLLSETQLCPVWKFSEVPWLEKAWTRIGMDIFGRNCCDIYNRNMLYCSNSAIWQDCRVIC